MQRFGPRIPRQLRPGYRLANHCQRRQEIYVWYKWLYARMCLHPPSHLGCPSINLTAGVQQIVAGLIALLSNNRISAGKPPLGFLNVWLYGNAGRGLMDITKGSNPGCKTDGFDAIEEWDPVGPLFVHHFRRWLTLRLL